VKWFQHQAAAHTDPKLKKVLMKYGFEGFGLYWYCIESVCHNLEPRLTFELEEDAEILAHVGSMDSRVIEEAMLYMVNLGLFSEADGVIACRKLALYLGDNLTRNTDLKGIIKVEKENAKLGLSDTVSDSLRLSQQQEKRGEEKKGEEKNKNKKEPVIKQSDSYLIPVEVNPEAWIEWDDYRRKKKKPISELAMKKAFKTLGKFTHDVQQAMVDKAIESDWQGLHPLSSKDTHQTLKAGSTKNRTMAEDLTDRSWAE
jgi:hypothetical protein